MERQRFVADRRDAANDGERWPAFLRALGAWPANHAQRLYALYQGWIDTLLALHAAA